MSDNIYTLISKISKEAGALAPEKSGGVPFAFRGVDSTINHLAPLLQEYGVVTIPEVLEHKVTSREVGNKVVTQSEVTTKFTFAAPDGSSVSPTTVGLAQDYADRSAAQAQSVAFRVALLQTFTLPTHQKEPEEAGEEVMRTTEAEKSKIVAAKPPASTPSTTALRAEVTKYIKGFTDPDTGEVRDPIPADKINDYATKKFKVERKVWVENQDQMTELVADIKAGKIK